MVIVSIIAVMMILITVIVKELDGTRASSSYCGFWSLIL